jgi:hypothetical protein
MRGGAEVMEISDIEIPNQARLEAPPSGGLSNLTRLRRSDRLQSMVIVTCWPVNGVAFGLN